MQYLFSEKVKRLNAAQPLVHCITNQVTTSLVANSLLALGASPIMSSHPDEVEAISGLADALYLNIGTLQPATLSSMLKAGMVASRCGIPIVLDPVGAGLTETRSKACLHLLNELNMSAVRGNASEIMALADLQAMPHGVDACHQVEEACVAADVLAKRHGLVVALTGVSDYASNGDENCCITGGHSLMAKVSGMGCVVGALLAAWLTLPGDRLTATAELLQIVAQCGLEAGRQSHGPGSFVTAWLDQLYQYGK